MIEALHLTKTFRDKKRGEIRAADDISFRVSPGQIYGLLGANGAGKTTTLRLLATLLNRRVGERRGPASMSRANRRRSGLRSAFSPPAPRSTVG